MYSMSLGWLLVALALLVSTLSLVISVLGLVQTGSDSVYNNGTTILLIVSGFTIAVAFAASSVVLLTLKRCPMGITSAVIVLYLFELACGIAWAVDSFQADGLRGKYAAPIIAVFVVNEAIASATLPLAIMYFHFQVRRPQHSTDQEKDAGQTASTLNEFSGGELHKSGSLESNRESGSIGANTIKSSHSNPVSKKVSERTLVEQMAPILIQNQPQAHQYTNSQDSKFADTVRFQKRPENPHRLSEILTSDIISASIKKTPDEFSTNFTADNWMESGTKLYSLAFPSDLQLQQTMNKKTAIQRKASFGKFMLNLQLMTLLRRSSYTLSNSKSVPTFFKTTKRPDFLLSSGSSSNSKPAKFVEVESAFKAPVANSSPTLAQEVNFGTTYLESEVPQSEQENRPVSLIKSTSENTISDIINGKMTLAQGRLQSQMEPPKESSQKNQMLSQDNHVSIPQGKDKSVKRSKSTSYVGGHRDKMRKREERWKSINDEKIFLLQVNESLLPSVLKTGESHIMELKRQQELNSLTNSITSPTIGWQDLDAFVDLVPKELRDDNVEVDGDITSVYEDDDDENINLPNISEFGERQQDTGDLSVFKGFTQDTLVLLSREKQGNYDIVDVDELQIPKSTSYQQPEWREKGVEKKQKKSYISLQNWTNNSDSWKQERQRNGSSTNNGVVITVSNGEHDFPMSKVAVTVKRPPFNMLNRSFSAPSLHTFRDFSSSSDGSGSTSADNERQIATASTDMTLNNSVHKNPSLYLDCKTPPVRTEMSSSSSPIKKFFQESPKRFSSVFKRQSRQSLEIDPRVFGHQHNSSVVSNAYSLSSTKSNSPRKSLKSLLTKKNIHTHSKNASVPSMSFPLKDQKLDIQASSWYTTAKSYSYDYKIRDPREAADALDQWDINIEGTPMSDQSRVSSVPSAVVGEYDKEKWRTLKALENQESIMLNLNEF